MNEVELKAEHIFDVLHRTNYWRRFLNSFCLEFDLDHEEVRRTFVEYMVHSGEHDNQFYLGNAVRYAMIVESEQPDSWHRARRQFLTKCLDYGLPSQQSLVVHDYGFGIVRPEYIERGKKGTHKFWLSDIFPSAIDVGRFRLHHEECNPDQCGIQFNLSSLDSAPAMGSLADVVLLLDSIEHADKPTKALARIVEGSKLDTIFGMIIPVGPKIASHHIAWSNTTEVRKWLGHAGLLVKAEDCIFPDGKFDLFSDSTGDTFGYACVCERG